MASKSAKFIYWDSCVFLSYINKHPDRYQIIDSIWDQVSSGHEARIITSTEAIVEVAWVEVEKQERRPNAESEDDIDAMWRDPSVQLIDVHQEVAFLARKLMRYALSQGWQLRSKDAVHLATAQWVNQEVSPVVEFFTYDDGLMKYGPIIGISICKPHVDQLSLGV